jgi:two-component system response regulator BaeR/two-component system response regulator AdeR
MNEVILIVEDEARLAEILDEYLEREGFGTERAKDGRRASRLAVRT